MTCANFLFIPFPHPDLQIVSTEECSRSSYHAPVLSQPSPEIPDEEVNRTIVTRSRSQELLFGEVRQRNKHPNVLQ